MQPSDVERRRNFVLTWLAYGAYYLCRRPFPIAKSTLGKLYALDERVLGRMETAYLVAYALGQFASGLAADRVGARRLVGYGMFAVAVVSAAFGLGSSAAVFALAFTLQGLLQSTGWPGVVKAMATIFRSGERGTAMGLWATSYQVGGLAASGLATYLLVHFGWRASFFVPAVLTAAVGLAVLRWLWEAPPSPPQERRRASLDVAREPLLWALSAAYFCIKLIRYTLVFWLPYFYERALHYSTERAGYLSISFDLGGVAGAILGGRLFDRTGRFRGWLIVILAFGLAIGTSLYARAAVSGPLAAFAGMVLVGALLFGPDALVSSMAAQDLGGSAAAGTAAGFINGVGSVGAALQGILIGEVASRFGWNAVFWMFGALSVAAALAVVPYAIATARPRPS